MSTTRILESRTLPDIDMNEAPTEPFVRAQAEVLGQEHSYPMIAYGTFKTSAAWKLYAKSQNVPFEIANAVSDQIKRYELAVKHADEDEKDDIDVGKYIDKEYLPIFEKSSDYRGMISSWSIAPCSSLIYAGDIRKEIGLIRIKDNLCCLMDGHWAEEGHFLKNDNLKVSVVESIYKMYHSLGVEPPSVKELIEMCPPDDPVWSIYERGCCLGINQVEKEGTASRVGKYKPTNIAELTAFVAAIRPGFSSLYKKFENREHFEFGIPSLDNVIQTKEFKESFLLYQESIMGVMNYAGIPMDECYAAIKNIAKKRAEKVLAYKETFSKGMTERLASEGYSPEKIEEVVNTVWTTIEDASQYSFNCVSGDTVIQKHGVTKSRFNPTVEEMYLIANDSTYAEKHGHSHLHNKYVCNGYGNALSMYPDGKIKVNRIVDIYPSGLQEVFIVETESGCTVKCTENHKFPTPFGEKTLSELCVGDVIFKKGKYEKLKKNYNLTDGNFKKNYPSKGKCGFVSNPEGNSRKYNEARERHISDSAPCDICGCQYDAEKRFELHHVDFDRTNNDESNYQWLCVSCHKKVHFANGRNRAFGNGIPSVEDRIKSITPAGIERTYDVEMQDPAHTFVTDSGLIVSNCSHAYCVALDSLYCAWIKAHHPMKFYETYIEIQEAKGDKDKITEAKQEAEEYFGIRFMPMRFRQDNRKLHTEEDKLQFINTLSSIKGFGASVGRIMYECGKGTYSSFMDLLAALDAKGIKEAKYSPLIKIGYFSEFGNQHELLEIARMWEFFKHGDCTSIKKKLVEGSDVESFIAKYANSKRKDGSDAASYTFASKDDVMSCMRDTEDFIRRAHLRELSMKVMIQNSIDILGYADVMTGKEEDRRKLLITDVTPLKEKKNGSIWAYRVGARSLGSGKQSRLSIRTNVFEKTAVKPGDIIYAESVYKNNAGYWYLTDYRIEE